MKITYNDLVKTIKTNATFSSFLRLREMKIMIILNSNWYEYEKECVNNDDHAGWSDAREQLCQQEGFGRLPPEQH